MQKTCTPAATSLSHPQTEKPRDTLTHKRYIFQPNTTAAMLQMQGKGDQTQTTGKVGVS